MLQRLLWAALALLVGAGVVVLLAYRPPTVQITLLPPPPTATPAPLEIYITGAVATPEQMLILAPGSRVDEAVKAAGGFSLEADREGVNLAQPLYDGQQVHIPRLGEGAKPPPLAATPESANAAGLINVNTAEAAELMRLPGVGESLAAAIIAYREANGPFSTLADLDNVAGVGPARLAQWRNLIRFQ
jgi:competence protein ComEA